MSTAATVVQHHEALLNRCRGVMEISLSGENCQLQCKSLNFVQDYEKWVTVLGDRSETTIFTRAIKEYQFALLAVSIGHYRQAYSGLRLFFELAALSLHLSAHEIELRLWLRSEKDTSWHQMVTSQTSIFSDSYCRVFFEDLKDHIKDHKTLSEQIYRECSEFVHANYHTLDVVPDLIEFSQDSFSSWHDKSESIYGVLTFLFSMRYLKSLNSDRRAIIEPVVSNELSWLEPIRAFFAVPAGDI